MTSAVATAARTATPVADAVLANPLAIPPGVAPWLRQWERTLRLALRDAVAAAPSGRSVPAWDDALAELRGIDPDARDGVFQLLLQRPLWQLEMGSAARETFERYAETVLERVDAARALIEAIAPLLGEREALIDEYGARFPNRLAEQLERVRAREVDIARLRRAVDATRMQARLDRARRAMEQVERSVAGDAEGAHSGSTTAIETETVHELRAALELARRTRRQLALHVVALREHRAQLVAQLRGLALSAPASARAAGAGDARRTGHTAIVLEQLIHAAGSAGGDSLDGRDAPLWTGALSSALAAHHPGLDRFAWVPALLARGEGDTHADTAPMPEAELLHVVPVGAGLLYLSPLSESVVRVRTRTVRLGETVECQVAPDVVARHAPALVDADVAALFDGHDAERSRWYRTERRATATIVASVGRGWFARLGRKGSVTVMEQPAWHSEAPGAAFRILRPARHVEVTARPGEDVDTIALTAPRAPAPPVPSHSPEPAALARDTAHSTFLGFTLREVRTGLLGDERAWARGLTQSWPGAADAVRREADLFASLRAHVGESGHANLELSLHPVTWVQVADERATYPLYRIPIATLDAPRRLRSWIVERDEHLLAVVHGVARVISAAHASGYALGVCHAEAFAFGVTWAPNPLSPLPSPILAHAPCATRIGEPYAVPGAASLTPAYYPMLRTPVLVPQVAAGQIATRERDMQGFGAFVLDLLLEHPIFERGTLDWYDAPAVVRARASQCSAHPTVAKFLGDLVQDPLGWRRLGNMLERAAAGSIRKVAELL